MPGDIARWWEQDILHSLVRRGIHLGPQNIAGKFSGFTEAWVQEDFPARSLKELMQLVYDDEGDSTTTSPTSVSSLRPLLEQPPNR
jgi:hypothetical protein